jgi:hypothetical protein
MELAAKASMVRAVSKNSLMAHRYRNRAADRIGK